MNISPESDDSSATGGKRSVFSNPFAIAFGVVVLVTIVAMPFLLEQRGADDVAEGEDGATADLTQGIVLGGSGDIVRGESAEPADAPPLSAAIEDPAGRGENSGESEEGAASDTLAIREMSAVDEGTEALVGGRIALVSSREPGVVVFDDGQRFATGARLPNGHVVAGIERERIVLEREGVVSVVRLP